MENRKKIPSVSLLPKYSSLIILFPTSYFYFLIYYNNNKTVIIAFIDLFVVVFSHVVVLISIRIHGTGYYCVVGQMRKLGHGVVVRVHTTSE